MPDPIRIASLFCWHANELIYQADGKTDDNRSVYVRYRRPWFSVGVGDTEDDAVGDETFTTDAHSDHDPSSITLATLKAWTADANPRIEWPGHIDGYDNEKGPLRDPC